MNSFKWEFELEKLLFYKQSSNNFIQNVTN